MSTSSDTNDTRSVLTESFPLATMTSIEQRLERFNLRRNTSIFILPAETRNYIAELVLTEDKSIEITDDYELPTLLRTNKHLYETYMGHYLQCNVLSFDIRTDISYWIAQVGIENLMRHGFTLLCSTTRSFRGDDHGITTVATEFAIECDGYGRDVLVHVTSSTISPSSELLLDEEWYSADVVSALGEVRSSVKLNWLTWPVRYGFLYGYERY